MRDDCRRESWHKLSSTCPFARRRRPGGTRRVAGQKTAADERVSMRAAVGNVNPAAARSSPSSSSSGFTCHKTRAFLGIVVVLVVGGHTEYSTRLVESGFASTRPSSSRSAGLVAASGGWKIGDCCEGGRQIWSDSTPNQAVLLSILVFDIEMSFRRLVCHDTTDLVLNSDVKFL